MTRTASARIEVFRPGTFAPMTGEPITFSADDLRAIAASYDAASAPAPVVVGHPATDAPAYAWASGIEFDEASGRLLATLGDIEPAFADAVRAGRYRKVSMAFFKPDAPNNPRPGGWYPKHVGFLGGAAPAVPGLQPVSFSATADEIATFEFGEPGFEQSASLFRGLRDWMIEQFGLETADKVLPAYRLEWLDDTDIEQPRRVAGFSTPIKETEVTTNPAPSRSPAPAPAPAADPAFAEREAAIALREKKLADRERELRHADNAAFAEQLVSEGRLIPKMRDKVAALLDAAADAGTVAFAGEAEQTLDAALRAILSAQPKVIAFGAHDLGDDPEDGGATVAFASDGKQVDQDRLAIHARALAYQKAHPGTDYAAAVDAVR